MASKLQCPYCDNEWGSIFGTCDPIPVVVPALCDKCLNVSLVVNGKPRTVNSEELEAIMASKAGEVIRNAKEVLLDAHTALQQKQTQEPPRDNAPTIDLWAQERTNSVSFIIRNSEIIEHDGELMPGISMQPLEAIEFAQALLAKASEILSKQGRT